MIATMTAERERIDRQLRDLRETRDRLHRIVVAAQAHSPDPLCDVPNEAAPTPPVAVAGG